MKQALDMSAPTEPVVRFSEPARRHRCDVCKEVFECHLCEIGQTHPLHSESRLNLNHAFSLGALFFVCEECAPEHLPTVTVESTGQSYKTYDYMTGKVLRLGPSKGAA